MLVMCCGRVQPRRRVMVPTWTFFPSARVQA
jgi:hypothetical protein